MGAPDQWLLSPQERRGRDSRGNGTWPGGGDGSDAAAGPGPTDPPEPPEAGRTRKEPTKTLRPHGAADLHWAWGENRLCCFNDPGWLVTGTPGHGHARRAVRWSPELIPSRTERLPPAGRFPGGEHAAEEGRHTCNRTNSGEGNGQIELENKSAGCSGCSAAA